MNKDRDSVAVFIAQWDKYDFHRRGCLLEAIAQDIETGMMSRADASAILRHIAAGMK